MHLWKLVIGCLGVLLVSAGNAFELVPVDSFDSEWSMLSEDGEAPPSFYFQGPLCVLQGTGAAGTVYNRGSNDATGIAARIRRKDTDTSSVAFLSVWDVGERGGNRIAAQLWLTRYAGAEEIRFLLYDSTANVTLDEIYYPNPRGSSVFLGLAREGNDVAYYIEGLGLFRYPLDPSITAPAGAVVTGFGAFAGAAETFDADVSGVKHVKVTPHDISGTWRLWAIDNDYPACPATGSVEITQQGSDFSGTVAGQDCEDSGRASFSGHIEGDDLVFDPIFVSGLNQTYTGLKATITERTSLRVSGTWRYPPLNVSGRWRFERE